jgi:soluble lytic murein transglycosylase-like protein
MAHWTKAAAVAAIAVMTAAPPVARLVRPATDGRTAAGAPEMVRAGAETIVLPSVLPMAEPRVSEAAKDPALIDVAFAVLAREKATDALAASPRLAHPADTLVAAVPPGADDAAAIAETPREGVAIGGGAGGEGEGGGERAGLEDLVRRAAAARGMPEAVAFAVVAVESGWDPKKKGAEGGIGLMQVVPRIARQFGFRGRDAALWDPETNVKWGMAYVGGAYRKAGGDLCRTAMKIAGGHYVETMLPQHRAYCDRLKAAMAARDAGGAAAAGQPGAGAAASAPVATAPEPVPAAAD